ncbi:MAG TPA: hypothetical protein VGY57_11075 [Vicinamibacterales bacterium]|nr:hypothetical protein [Vicinamibacterales bacterium]
MKLIGILLIAFGIVALVVGGIRYTKTEQVLKIGPLEATTQEHTEIPLPPVLGIISIVGGVILIVADSRTRV